jgi:hypothetical protein
VQAATDALVLRGKKTAVNFGVYEVKTLHTIKILSREKIIFKVPSRQRADAGRA